MELLCLPWPANRLGLVIMRGIVVAVLLGHQLVLADNSARVELTPEERAWLAQGHTVRVRLADWPPFQITKPSPSGISADYLNAVATRFAFKVTYVTDSGSFADAVQDVTRTRQRFDLMPNINRTPEREKQFALTADYLTTPWAIFTRRDSPFISGLAGLNEKTIAIERGYAIVDKLKSAHPAIHLLEVPNSVTALETVATGRADAYVGNLTNAAYIIKAYRLDNLMVAAPTPFGDQAFAMGVRSDWPELASLISKGLVAMSAEDRLAISQRWGSLEFRNHIDYTLVWQIVAVAMVILVAILYWNLRLAKEIARRQRVELDLQQAKEAAEAANIAKSAFLANMSHELRTPLNGIMGMANLAERRATDPAQKDQLAKVIQSTQRLVGIINNILDISKIEAERLELEHVDFLLGPILENLLALTQRSAGEKGLTLDADIAPRLADLMLQGDPHRLGQILTNLTGNAIKFTTEGSVTVRAQVVEENSSEIALRFEVRDTGIGISAEDQKRIFNPFEQADSSMTRKYGGTGLGLAISRRLAEAMGGSIGVESQAGLGSCFWFAVKLRKVSKDAIT